MMFAQRTWLTLVVLTTWCCAAATKEIPMLDSPIGRVFATDEFAPLPPRQRLHLILLGVENVARSAAFYTALGWQKSATGHDGFVKFDLGGYALCLLPRADLARDALVQDAQVQAGSAAPDAPRGDFAGIGLVYLAQTAAEVPAILAKVQAAGGTVIKPATRTPWGIAGYFKDPDGHLFEVDYEEVWVFDDQHRLEVEKLNSRTK